MSKKSRLVKSTEEIEHYEDGKSDKKVDKSPRVFQRPRINYHLTIKERPDFTERQKVILETMMDKNTRCVLVDGYWGTGKSTLAILAALKLLNEGKVKQILYVRSPAESSNSATIGILPGELSDRLAAYNAILFDKLEEMLPGNEIAALIKDKTIECMPPGLIRGRNYNATAIVVDECGSLSWEDFLLIASRAGEFTRLFFIGDSFQSDIRNSGFNKFFDKFDDLDSKEHGIFGFKLQDKDDVVRSGFLRYLMEKVGIIKYMGEG